MLYRKLITKFIKILSPHYWGQKTFFDSLVNLKQLTKNHPFSVITAATKNLRPGLKLISRVIAGKKVYVTTYIPPQNSNYFAFTWLVKATKGREQKTVFSRNLSLELIEAFHKKGLAYKTKLDYNITLKDNKKNSKSSVKKKGGKAKKYAKLQDKKPFTKNDRLKRNDLKKNNTVNLEDIKKKIMPIFRESMLLRYISHKHKNYQENVKLNVKPKKVNVVFQNLAINQYKKPAPQTKIQYKLKLKKIIKLKIIGNVLLKTKFNNFKQKLITLQKNTQRQYVNFIAKIKLPDKMRKRYELLRKRYQKLKIKLNLNTKKLNRLLSFAKSKKLRERIRVVKRRKQIDRELNQETEVLPRDKKYCKINKIIHKYHLRKYLTLVTGYGRYLKNIKITKNKPKWREKRINRLKKTIIIPKINGLRMETQNYIRKRSLLTNQLFFKTYKLRKKKIDYRKKTTRLIKIFNAFSKRIKKRRSFFAICKKLLKLSLVKNIRKYILINNKPKTLDEKIYRDKILKYNDKFRRRKKHFARLVERKEKENFRETKKVKRYASWLHLEHLDNRSYALNLIPDYQNDVLSAKKEDNSILLSLLSTKEPYNEYLAIKLVVNFIISYDNTRANDISLFGQKNLDKIAISDLLYVETNKLLYQYYFENEQLNIVYDSLHKENQKLAINYIANITKKLAYYEILRTKVYHKGFVQKIENKTQKALNLKTKLIYFATNTIENPSNLKFVSELTNFFNARNVLHRNLIRNNKYFATNDILLNLAMQVLGSNYRCDEIILFAFFIRLISFSTKNSLTSIIVNHMSFTAKFNKPKVGFEYNTTKALTENVIIRQRKMDRKSPRNIADLKIYYSNCRLRKTVKKIFGYNHPKKRNLNTKFKLLYNKFLVRAIKLRPNTKYLFSKAFKRIQRRLAFKKGSKTKKRKLKKKKKKVNKRVRRARRRKQTFEQYSRLKKNTQKTPEEKKAQRTAYYKLYTKNQREIIRNRRLDLKDDYLYSLLKEKYYANAVKQMILRARFQLNAISKFKPLAKRMRFLKHRRKYMKYRKLRYKPRSRIVSNRYVLNPWGFRYNMMTKQKKRKTNEKIRKKKNVKRVQLPFNGFTQVNEKKAKIVVSTIIVKLLPVLANNHVTGIRKFAFHNCVSKHKFKSSLNLNYETK